MLRLHQENAHQMSLFESMLPPELKELPEDLAKLDRWLDDPRFFEPFMDKYDHAFGRPSIPAETYLRVMTLKHQYGLSDRDVIAFVNDRISWRRFCRIPWEQPVLHPSSLSKIRRRLDADGGDHMALLNEHLVQKASETRLLRAQKVRVDTTVTDANIHYPTDATLMQDGVRTITRIVKRIQTASRVAAKTIRDRGRSIKKRILAISKLLKRRSGQAFDEVRKITAEIADRATETVRDAKRFLRSAVTPADGPIPAMTRQLRTMVERTERVIEQARQVNKGNVRLPHRVVSVFDPDARPITRGKLHRKTEFGYKVVLAETEERVITDYTVHLGNPSDEQLLSGSIERHTKRVGRKPKRVATDRGFWSKKNEDALLAMGVKQPSLPVRGKRSQKRRRHERQGWFRRLQRWRAGQEAAISVLKRRYGLDRTRYRGHNGAKRWIGGSVWAYNLNSIVRLV